MFIFEIIDGITHVQLDKSVNMVLLFIITLYISLIGISIKMS